MRSWIIRIEDNNVHKNKPNPQCESGVGLIFIGLH